MVNFVPNNVLQHATATESTLNQVAASLGTAILVSLSATSAFIFPEMGQPDQQMADIHIAFCFTAVMLVVVFLLAVFRVRDKQVVLREQAKDAMETMPGEGMLEGAAETESAVPSAGAPDTIGVSLVMNKTPYYVTTESTLADKRLKKVPVVKDGKLVGSLSRSDIVRSTMENLALIEKQAETE